MLDNEAIELEFISVLIYYMYKRKLEREESMMCRNDKSRVGPKWKTQQKAMKNHHNLRLKKWSRMWDSPERAVGPRKKCEAINVKLCCNCRTSKTCRITPLCISKIYRYSLVVA